MLFFPAIVVVFITTVNACTDNALWRDTFGWTCRDYNRDPLECGSRLAVSEGGIQAREACCSCKKTHDRRRDYSTCVGSCDADEDACEADCRADTADCRLDCMEENPTFVVEPEPPISNGGGNGNLETWVIILIVIGAVLFLCIICIILYFLFMGSSEATCEDDECTTQQPMLIGGGCDGGPCDAPCDGPIDNQGNQMAYGPVTGYPQQGGWQ